MTATSGRVGPVRVVGGEGLGCHSSLRLLPYEVYGFQKTSEVHAKLSVPSMFLRRAIQSPHHIL